MKLSKKHLFIFLILLFSNLVCFALPENPLALNFSLGTSAIVYGDENIKLERDNYFLEDYSRFVINTEASFQFFLDEYVAFNFGGIASVDLFKNEKANMFLLKYDIFSGIRKLVHHFLSNSFFAHNYFPFNLLSYFFKQL